MTPGWRTTLRVRALLRLLLEKHVPMGTLDEVVTFVASFSDSVLVDEQRRCGGSDDAGHSVPRLARDLSCALIDEDADGWQLQRERWRVVIEEIRARASEARRLGATEGLPCGEPIAAELDALLRFIGSPMREPSEPQQ